MNSFIRPFIQPTCAQGLITKVRKTYLIHRTHCHKLQSNPNMDQKNGGLWYFGTWCVDWSSFVKWLNLQKHFSCGSLRKSALCPLGRECDSEGGRAHSISFQMTFLQRHVCGNFFRCICARQTLEWWWESGSGSLDPSLSPCSRFVPSPHSLVRDPYGVCSAIFSQWSIDVCILYPKE